MSETTDFWSGDFGDQYVKRNRFDWRKRYPFWGKIIDKTGARSVHEVGCNVGYNLTAIRYVDDIIKVRGEDVNDTALHIAESAGLHVHPAGLQFTATMELVFTSGVLIHIAPQDLKAFMQRIVEISCDYVLAIEYEAEQEEEVIYRGHAGKLWKRPYGRLYEELGLALVETGILGENDGFDKCRYWLLRK